MENLFQQTMKDYGIWSTRSPALWQHVQLFVSTSFPQWQQSCSDNGWAPILSPQRVGGSPLATSPISQSSWAQAHSMGADLFDFLIYGGKRTKSKNGRGGWQKIWAPVELDLGFAGNKF